MDLEKIYSNQRQNMVAKQLVAKGRDIRDTKVLQAMQKVPRHIFVQESLRDSSYMDQPLPIGENQTISQPYIVAFMTEILKLSSSDRVLEIGTGCGYQTAVLAEIAKEVYSVEIIEPLAKKAQQTLCSLGYQNIHLKKSDGTWGWPEYSPFDKILVACASPMVPEALKEQLAIGGLMIIPVNNNHEYQNLTLVQKVSEKEFISNVVMAVRFVPMTGDIQNF